MVAGRRAGSLAVAACIALVATAPAWAGKFEDDIESRWLGAWVLTRVDAYSACGGLYTNNRINGTLVRSSGGVAFDAGELARIDRVDVNRSRVDVLISVTEPVLLQGDEGPFTLYHEAACRIEFEVEVPREVVKARDGAAVDQALRRILEPHASNEDARASSLYNARQRDEYPDDYATTLAELAAWRAERTNEAVQAALDGAARAADRLVDRVESDPDYVAGFAAGVEQARATAREGCRALLATDVSSFEPRFRSEMTPDERRRLRGHADGATLVTALAMMRELPACFVPVPQPGDHVEMAAASD